MATSGGQTLGVTISGNMDPSGVLGAVKQMQGAFSGLKLPANLTGDILKDFNKLQESLKKFDSIAKQDHFSKTDLKNLEKLQKEIDSTFGSLKSSFNDLSGQKIYLDIDYTKIKEAKAVVDELKADIQSKLSEIKIDFSSTKGGTASLGLDELIAGMERGVKSSKVLSAAMGEVKQSLKAGDFSTAANQLSQIITKSNDLKGAGTGLLNTFKQWGLIDFSTPANELVKTKKGAELLATALGKIEKTGAENLAKEMSAGAQSAEHLGNAFKTVGQSSREMAQGVSQAAEQVKQLQQSTQYFFSLRNMINLLKRGIREAVDVVKELDAAMTETAVVTDYSVGDMWQKLPEYTANANALGATVKDMYEATTLYYQQGLRTEAAMGIANETMKMARIGGLEAADATDKMTAALRGFNMEINEMSAQRVNDVYSNLAAKTASNTEELGTAMQRTASIAHSAGMSFEGTAAFLAQAIETTREPAENLGTAMKTIVARFTELKKNPLEITEVDGEEVSYNKVDTALQSIGVSLKDANGQFRDLDKVFLDISKRWDSLTQTQQRYIATTAAGSRQQSRFIAMMSNYERTMQLMDFANNSAGASNEQFGKTMESLEAKINKLRNAWNEFLMGIMNDKWTKRLVDAGTGILNLVNKIIDKLSFNGELGLVKSFLSIATAFTALKAGGNIINKLIGGLGGLVDPTSSFGKGFWGAGKTTAQGTPTTGVAGKITTPIVAKLSELIAVVRGNKENPIKTTSTIDQYKNTSAMLRNTQSLGMGGIRALFNGLSDEHAYVAYKNTPGTVDSMKKAALGWLGSQKMPADAQKTGQQLMNAIFKGMSKKEISIKDGMKLLGQPQQWGKYFGTDVAQSFSQNFTKAIRPEQMADARKQAAEMAWKAIGGDPYASDAIKQIQYNQKDSAFRKAFNQYYKNIRIQQKNKSALDFDNIPVTQNNLQQLANNVGILGSKFSAAGMSIQMFGAQLGQLSPALEGVGTLLSRVGMTISTFGMGISGLGTIVTKGAAAIKAGTALAVSSMAATPGVIGAGAAAGKGFITGMAGSLGMSTGLLGGIIGAVVIGAIALVKGHLDKKAKEAGEEVRENFEKGFTETNKKIDSLEGYKDRFNELSKGVDQFGHNINLTDEEYDEYLSISRDLQELSPSLIAGYNAEGQAILRKGEAIDEVINKLKEERDLSLDSYISDDSVEKLIKAYNTSDAYKQHHTTIKDTASQNTIVSAFNSEKSGISNAIKKAGLEWSDFSQILDELGIGGAASISQLTNTQLGLISDHYIDVLNKIKEFNPQIEQEAEEGLKEAFANTNNAIEDVLTEGAPIINALHQWMGQEKLDAVGLNLGEEFVSGFNSGIEGLMLEGLTNNWKPEEYKSQLKDYANEWKNLAGPTSDYTRILKEADEIQEDYLDHIGEEGAVEDYKENIEDSAQKLEDLANSTNTATEAGRVFQQQCITQANALRNYATEGVESLGEALNTLSDEFTSARGAQERFQKATEGGDYYTAAEGYKSIIDTVLDDKNKGGDGSLTGWAGADELLGQDFVDNHNWDEIVAQIEKIQGCFEDGSDGVIAFNDLLTENADKLEGLGHVGEDGFEFDLQTEDLAEYAKTLHMSEDALAALIDKARQWVPIDLSDPRKVRQAIESSDYSMVGTSSKGESLVYTTESQFRTETYQQGIRGDDYTLTKQDAESKGIRFLTVENLTAKNGAYANQVLDNIGLKGADKTLDNSVAALTKMGFDLEETKQILTADGIKLADGKATDEDVEKAYNEQAYEMENPTVANIASNTDVLVSNTSAMLAAMGIITEEAKKTIEDNTSNETIKGYTDLLNKDYTNTSDRNAAREQVQAKIDEYQSTIDQYAQGGLTADNNEYIKKLVEARDQLNEALNTEAISWQNKIGEYTELFSNLGNDFVNEHAIDFANAFSIEDINQSAAALRQLEEEGKLTHTEMRTLAAEFMQVNRASLKDLDTEQLDTLCTKLGLTKNEATGLLDALGVPFVLEGRLEGEDLETYIKNFDGLDDSEKTIFLRTDVSGNEKAEILIDKINKEFGNGDEKKKSVIIEATAEMANDNQEEAEKILSDAGFSEEEVKTITQKLSIIVNGSVANPDQVKAALQSELNGLELTADAKVNVNANIGKKISKIGTSVDVNTKAIDDAKTKADKTKGTIQVDANTDAANRKIASLKNVGSTTLTVNAQKGTGWTQTMSVTVNEHNARGRNFSIPAHHSLSFGSAAGGMNVPKPKKSHGSQITALVGEEGFEVGYIPSEARSVIFGSNGPEMTSFPKDTIIYPHKQSQEILRRGKGSHIKAGSYQGGLDSIKSKGLLSNLKKEVKTTSTTKKTTKKDSTTTKDDKDDKDHKKLKKAIQKVNWWWDKTAQRLDVVSKKTERYNKTLERKLADLRASINSVNKANTNYINSLKKQNKYYKQEEKRASIALGKQKATTKKEKNNRKLDRELIVSLKNSKGKAKDKSISATKYTSYDKATGAYYADYSKIKKGIKGKENRKTVYDAVEGWVKDYTGKYNTAKDAQLDNLDKIADIRKEIDNTFFGWKNELDKIYKITGKIEQLEAKINKEKSSYDYNQFLLDQQDLARGMTKDASDYLKQMKQATTLSKDYYEQQIKEKEGLIGDSGAIRKAQSLYGKLTNKSVTYETKNGDPKTEKESKIYNRIKNLKGAKRGSGESWDELSDQEKQIYARGRAFSSKYITGKAGSYSFNNVKIEQDRASGKVSKELYELIKDTYDTLHQYDLDLVTAEGEIIDLKTNELQAQKQYEDTVKQISEELYGWKNTLTYILQLTNKIEQSEKRTALLKNGQDFYSAKQKAGYEVSSADILKTYVGQMVSTINQIQDREKLIEERKNDLQSYITGANLNAEIQRFTEVYKNNQEDDTLKAALDNLKKEAQYRIEAQKYVTTTPNADGTVSIVLNSKQLELDKLAAEGDAVATEKFNKIEEFAQEIANKNNEIAEAMAANATDVTELYSALADLKQIYSDRMKELREAYGAQQQKVIDNIKTLYSAVDNSFKELISKVKQNIQQRRQTEDNAKTEQDISKKQQRLAMLRADTSGGNKVEIAQLQQEIADAQQNYGRTLEDQMMEKLSQQGDVAAQQRQHQIELLQAQRDIAVATGQDARKIEGLVAGLTSGDQTIAAESQQKIQSLFQDGTNWTSLTATEQKMLSSEIGSKITEVNTLPSKIDATEKAIGLLNTEIGAVEASFENSVLTALQTATKNIADSFTTGLSGVSTDLKAIGAALGTKLTETDNKIQQIEDSTAAALASLQEQIDAATEAIADAEAAKKEAEEAAKKADEEAKQKQISTHKDTLSDYGSKLDSAFTQLKQATEANNPKKIKAALDEFTTLQTEAQSYTSSHNELPEEQYANFLFNRGNKVDTGNKHWSEIGETGLTNMINWGSQFGKTTAQVFLDLVNTEGLTWKEIIKAAYDAGMTKEELIKIRDQFVKASTKNSFGKAVNTVYSLPEGHRLRTNFLTGGLADFTGPAWLDGTPSKPELVLNATDTQNFLALRDVLSKAMNATNSVTNSYGGDAMYEININVDHLSSDYDVDRVVEKVKKEIVKGSGYRNVTQVRNFR